VYRLVATVGTVERPILARLSDVYNCWMPRRLLLRVLRLGALAVLWCAAVPTGALAQATGVLHVRVVLEVDGQPRPAPRHALLVSDTPPSRAPWRLRTGADGTARVTLPPGAYVVESEEPVVFMGRTYEWRQTVDVVAGQDARLDLSTANADISAAAPASPSADGAPARTDAWDLLVTWEQSVVPIWTPTMHASAIVIAPGVLATAQAALGPATAVAAQIGPDRRVTARVVRADHVRGVALLQVAPMALGSRRAMPLACDGASPSATRGPVSAISTPLRGQPTTTTGIVSRLEAHGLMATGDYPIASIGGPVFASDGTLLGLTTRDRGYAQDPEGEFGAASRQAICDVLAPTLASLPPPPADTPMPAEPPTLSEDALRDAAKRRVGSLQPARVSSAGFDVEFVTPPVAYAGLQQSMDFGAWTRYVADRPAVLLVRVTPRQVESLWMKLARGAAMTQGIALPPIKHYEPGFASMRVRCGRDEVMPVHPFVVERRVTETSAIREGLYAFLPNALGPHCGTVSFEIASEKTPEAREVATLDGKTLQQLWDDMTPWRSTTPLR